MGYIIFDIETGPEPESLLAELFEFDETKVKDHHLTGQEFDPKSVRYGNMKDEQKRAEKLEAERKKFEAAKKAVAKSIETERAEAWATFVEKAPLNPLTGRVVAIGYLGSNGQLNLVNGDGDEPAALRDFWETVAMASRGNHQLIGFNSAGFDLPFLVRRSWRHGVPIPTELVRSPNGRYWSPLFTDLLELWSTGDRKAAKLDTIARFFGVGSKPDGMDGGDFHRLWAGSEEDRQRAANYLENDLRMTQAVAERMGVV